MEKAYIFPIFPNILQVEPTNNCNFKCPACPRQMMTYPKGNMQFDVFKKIIDEASEKRQLMPVEIKLFYLGEPLLHPELQKMCEYMAAKGVPFGVTTNGSLLNYDNITYLLKYARQLGVSIDGYNNETYKMLRGGNYEDAVANIKRLCKLKKISGGKTTIRLLSVVPNNDAEAGQWVTEILKQWHGYDLIVAPLERHLYPNTSWLGEPSEIDKIHRTYLCEDGLGSLVIRWNGETTWCCGDVNTEDSIGNVKDKSIQEMWVSNKMWNIRKNITRLNYDANAVCKKCSINTALKHRIAVSLPAEYKKMLG